MNRKTNIGLIDYFNFFSKGNRDRHRENGNRRFAELYNKLEQNNFDIEPYNYKNFNNYDILLFKDIPRINILIILLIKKFITGKKVKLILWLDETPIARNRILLTIPFLFEEVWVNTIEKNFKYKLYKTITYHSASLPCKEEIKTGKNLILKGNRVKKICYVGSNKSAINKNSSYQFRAEIVKNLKKEFDEFKLYGRGWDKKSLPMDLPGIALLNNFKPFKKLIIKFININFQPFKSEGEIDSKFDVMLDFDFCLAFEPSLEKPFMVLDKIFDPMLAGCIPIYFGPNTNLGVPSNCYIRLEKNLKVKDLIEEIRTIDENKLKKYRENIYNFLISEKANNYRYETFTNIILNTLLKYKKRI